MNFNSPIPRAKQPTFHEGSALRSVRDGDSTAKQWQKNKSVSKAVNGIAQAVEQTQKQVNKLRRRVQPVVYPPKVGMVFRGEYYASNGYSEQEVVTVTGGVNQGTFICVAPVPANGTKPWEGGGYWVQFPAPYGAAKWF